MSVVRLSDNPTIVYRPQQDYPIFNAKLELTYLFEKGRTYLIEDPRSVRDQSLLHEIQLDFKDMVLDLDNYECCDCERATESGYMHWRGGLRRYYYDLEPHHLLTVKAHPELMFDVRNARSLCRECHNNRHVEAYEKYRFSA